MTTNREKKQKIVDEFLTTNESEVIAEPIMHVDSDLLEPQNESIEKKTVRLKIIEALKTVHDPEIPVNIYDLGLIYKIQITNDYYVRIEMTLTAPACPVAHLFPSMVKGAVSSVEEVVDTEVEIVWDPPWTQDRMSEAAKLELGMF